MRVARHEGRRLPAKGMLWLVRPSGSGFLWPMRSLLILARRSSPARIQLPVEDSIMNNAVALLGLAFTLCSIGLVLRVAGNIWLRAKELERGTPSDSARLSSALASLEARLARIEEAVDATAVEVERVTEGQRFAARQLAEGASVGTGMARST